MKMQTLDRNASMGIDGDADVDGDTDINEDANVGGDMSGDMTKKQVHEQK